MAKRKRNNKKRHNTLDNAKEDGFLEQVPETSEEAWDTKNHDDGFYEDQQESFKMEEKVHTEENNSINETTANTNIDQVLEELEESRLEEAGQLAETEANETNIDLDNTEDFNEETGSSFSLGNYLHDQRDAQGISLKNVSQSTKISITNLEALESDDLTSLPNRAYVTGYVKSYAKLIGADINLCLELLDKTYSSQGARPRAPEIVIPQATNSPQISNNSPMGKVTVVLSMVAILGAVIIFFANRNEQSSENSVDSDNLIAMEEPQMEEQEEKEITPQTLNAETPLQEDLPQTTSEVVKENTEDATLNVAEEKKVEVVKTEEVTKKEKEKVETKKEEVVAENKEEKKEVGL